MNLKRDFQSMRAVIREDKTIQQANQSLHRGVISLPSATARYLFQKVPAFQWLPKYSPRWIINDIIAGLTVGVILVPQALAYAKIAGIPLQDGLLASWLPSMLYFIMGTSKDVNTGPTSIIGLLTAQIIKEVTGEGYSSTSIAIAISFSVGIYSLVMGLLRLGFLLELVSLPVLTGFISAAALTIIAGQVPAIFGETVGTGFATQIHDIFTQLPKTKLPTLAVGITGILLLCIMQLLGSRFGKTNKTIWIISIGRNAIVIFLFTLISFAINNSLETPMFALTGAIPSGLIPPKAPDMVLVGKVFGPSLAVFIAAALEHIAIAKSFGRKSNYSIDQSQELTFLGLANLLNSFVGGMAVGGAASRTAVNSESGVKSPLSGLFTGVIVLISIYALTGALFWIPKATLAAIIIVAVWQIVVPPKVFYGFWKVSFADFVASQMAFWITLFVSAEMGIELATGFMILSTVLRSVFSKTTVVTKVDFSQWYIKRENGVDYGSQDVPDGVQVVKFSHPIIFLNAAACKTSIIDAVQTYQNGKFATSDPNSDRLWNELGAQHVALLRNKAGLSKEEGEMLPLIRVVVLDMQGVVSLDVTGIQALKDMRSEMSAYAGEQVQVRMIGLKEDLVGQLVRADLKVYGRGQNSIGGVVIYERMKGAVFADVENEEADIEQKEMGMIGMKIENV